MSTRLYNMLCDIINETYKENTKSELLQEYKKFYLEYSNKIGSTDGNYSWKNHKIVVRNLFKDDKILLFTTLRSLAHHIDFRNRGKTNSEWQYYAEFERLLRTSIVMGLISFLDIKDVELNDKESKILYKLEKEDLSAEKYKQGIIVFRVSNCFNVKDKLKQHNYKWLSNEKVWEKEVPEENVDDEISYLETFINLENLTTHSASELLLTGYMFVLVYECYDNRELLKQRGYKFDGKESAWKKRLNVEEVKYEVGKLAKLGFRTVKTKSA